MSLTPFQALYGWLLVSGALALGYGAIALATCAHERVCRWIAQRRTDARTEPGASPEAVRAALEAQPVFRSIETIAAEQLIEETRLPQRGTW
jgi:hypothetical protein